MGREGVENQNSDIRPSVGGFCGFGGEIFADRPSKYSNFETGIWSSKFVCKHFDTFQTLGHKTLYQRGQKSVVVLSALIIKFHIFLFSNVLANQRCLFTSVLLVVRFFQKQFYLWFVFVQKVIDFLVNFSKLCTFLLPYKAQFEET